MRVRMLGTAEGAPAGLECYLYRAGEVYTPDTEPPMSAELAEVLIRFGLAEPEETPPASPQERATTRAAARSPRPPRTK